MFEFKRLVQMLLHIVSTSDHEGFVQRIGIYLLNSVACQVNNKQKNELGDAGAIKVIKNTFLICYYVHNLTIFLCRK